MTLIDGDRIITAQLYDDEHEEFTEKKMSIIDYINAYTDEGVATEDIVEQTDGDLISKEAVIEWLKDKDIIKTKNQEENARRELAVR